MPIVDILLPTCNRLQSLIMTLSGVAAQSIRNLHVIVADQSQQPAEHSQVVQSLRRIIEARGGSVEYHHRPPVHGIAEQRDFLLKRATAENVLYLDDDVFMEPWVTEKLLEVLQTEHCGFVGAFPAGLSHRDDVRPQQQIVEFWDGPVHPEAIDPASPRWERWQLHRAANLYHVSQSLQNEGHPVRNECHPVRSEGSHRHGPHSGAFKLYKVAWIASCILYNRAKLLEIGGFSFWSRLPRYHSGEEVLVQNLLMRRWGGCAIMPSGTYYSQVPTTVLNEAGTVDGHALDLLAEMIEKYAPETSKVKTGQL